MKATAIIAAYNEESRIGNVLKATTTHPLIGQIIVVDDGSKDKTSEVARMFKRVDVITLKKNQGKSRAVLAGVKAARYEMIILLDADILGLDEEKITALIEPVSKGEADVSIGLLENSALFYRIIGIDFISGERVLKKKFLKSARLKNISGYGLEVHMNSLIIKRKLRIKVIKWTGVSQIVKKKKVGAFRGLAQNLKMLIEMTKTISPLKIVWQMLKMKSLTIRR